MEPQAVSGVNFNAFDEVLGSVAEGLSTTSTEAPPCQEAQLSAAPFSKSFSLMFCAVTVAAAKKNSCTGCVKFFHKITTWLLKNVNKIRLPLGQIQVFFQQKPILFYSCEAFFLPSGTHHQMTAVPNIADPAATHLNMGWARRSMDRPIITQVRSMA